MIWNALRAAARPAIGLSLLLWIFHRIFLGEGRRAWGDGHPAWDALTAPTPARMNARTQPGNPGTDP